MLLRVVCVVAVLCAAVQFAAASEDEEVHDAVEDVVDEPRTYVIEHAFSTPTLFTPRGKLVVASSTSKNGKVTQDVSEADLERLMSVASKGGNYYVRVRAQGDPDSADAPFGSVKACLLAASGGQETVTVAVDRKGGVQGVELSVSARTCDSQKKVSKVKTNAVISRSNIAPSPTVEQFVKTEEQKKEESPEQQSFLSKYWMWILGGMLVMQLLGGGGSAQPQQPPAQAPRS